MLQTIPCPLSDADCAKLTRMLQRCADTACILNSLKELGIDVAEFEAENNRHQSFATGAKAKFFPNAY